MDAANATNAQPAVGCLLLHGLTSSLATVSNLVPYLEARGIPTTVRDTRGSEIDGACGQLAAVE